MKPTKTTDLIRVPDPTINPAFFFPDDLSGVEITTGEDNLDDSSEVVIESEPGDTGIDGETSGADDVDSLATPQWLVVSSQTLRAAAGGSYVIDVVVECEDVLGATGYEVRVTKT